MSLVKVQGNASGTGIFTVTSPATNTDRTLTLPDDTGTFALTSQVPSLASAAETLTGTDTAKAITPGGFAGNKSLAASGYYKFPGGLIVQWGSGTTTSGSFQTVTYPVSFATTSRVTTSVDGNRRIIYTQSIGTSTFQVRAFDEGAGTDVAAGFQWHAIGY